MTESVIEKVILGSLIHNPHYYTVVLPHAKAAFFEETSNSIFFSLIEGYHSKYSCMPTKEAAIVELESSKGVNEENKQSIEEKIEKLYSDEVRDAVLKQSPSWLLDKTEKQFKDRACFNAIMDSLAALDNDPKAITTRDGIPDLLQKAVSISFSSDIGHDYLDDWEKRWAKYNEKIDKIPFSLHMLNKVTGGGHERKTLSLFIAGTGVGKTMCLTNEAAHLLMIGKNVVYVTLEMAAEKISERIDAKLMSVPMSGIRKMDLGSYKNKMMDLKRRSTGKLIVKEFPPRTITVKHLEAFLNEVKAKRGIVPDVLILDYMTLLNSYSMKGGGFENLYVLGKLVAEELRALAIRWNISILSASQTNRSGQANTDFDITDLGESHAISQTVDFMVGLISTPELELLNQMRMKLLKSRFGSLSEPNSWVIGIERAKMTAYDLDYTPDNSQQGGNNQPPPVTAPTSQPNVSKFKF